MTTHQGHHLADGESSEPKSFANFFEHWLGEQDRYLQSLRSLAAETAQNRAGPDEDDRAARPLIGLVVAHYESYYRAKSASAKRDVLPMFTPTWTSTTENLFHWVGGWRPTSAIHLLYSKSGLQVEAQLGQLVRGAPTGDLADLSPSQLHHVDRLHGEAVRLEREISEEEAAIQETVAGTQFVDLCHVITEGGEGAMEAEMRAAREAMERVLERADRQRIETLKGVVAILRPIQAVHFLIAAAELHLRVHEFGKNKDESRR